MIFHVSLKVIYFHHNNSLICTHVDDNINVGVRLEEECDLKMLVCHCFWLFHSFRKALVSFFWQRQTKM